MKLRSAKIEELKIKLLALRKAMENSPSDGLMNDILGCSESIRLLEAMNKAEEEV